nr:hypothetical protein [Thiomonas sp.]
MKPVIVPAVAFAASLGATAYFGVSLPDGDPSRMIGIGSAVASVSATLLGFLAAALAILASIDQSHLVGMMKKTGHYRDLLHTVMWAAIAFFLALALSMVVVAGWSHPLWLRDVLLATTVAALASLVDVGRKFWLTLANLRSS